MKSELPETTPIDFIPQDLYTIMRDNNLLNATGFRDFLIRKAFKEKRNAGISSPDAVEQLHLKYSYLSYESLRKVCISKV
jgi:hypothetical protein